MIYNRLLLIFLICAFSAAFVFAQHANNAAQTGVSLEAEIRNYEAAAAKQGITAAERHNALVNLARLCQLSGDIEGAARNWLEAAAAIPDKVDDDALLACAYCLAAMGEWDRAAAALDPLVFKNTRARFLSTSISAIKTKDLSVLGSLADNPAYSDMKAEILFVLWKLAGREGGGSSERWRQRLINEFPQTPEGRLAANSEQRVAVSPTPFWLFINGLDSLPLIPSESSGRTSQAASTTASATQSAVTQSTAAQSSVSQSTASTPRLQTGIFSRQANAQTHAANLRQAGFSPAIETRFVNNSEMWAVTVPAGSDQKRTANELRAAGFESFLVR
ncbi:MAG: SPOR domain-containing protein [Treponema sp.]|nr:SPOR domain-containing protein [Treponema sp.]